MRRRQSAHGRTGLHSSFYEKYLVDEDLTMLLFGRHAALLHAVPVAAAALPFRAAVRLYTRGMAFAAGAVDRTTPSERQLQLQLAISSYNGASKSAVIAEMTRHVPCSSAHACLLALRAAIDGSGTGSKADGLGSAKLLRAYGSFPAVHKDLCFEFLVEICAVHP